MQLKLKNNTHNYRLYKQEAQLLQIGDIW